MSNRVFSFILALIINTYGFAQWKELGSSNSGFVSTYNIVNIESTLFVSTGNGGIYKSSDNGSTWVSKNEGLPPNPSVQDLFENNGYLYVSVYQDGIYISIDQAESWTPINSGIENLTFYNIGAENSTIIAGNANGGIYFSSDNGTSWNEKSNNVSNEQIQDFAFFKSEIYAAGSYLFKSNNNGDTWVDIYINGQTPNGFRCMVTTDNKIYLGGDGNIFSSSDGVNWTNHNLNLGSTIISLRASGGKVYFTTGIGKLYYTENEGQNWTLIENTATTGLANDAIIFPNEIIMSTTQGLYSSKDNGITWFNANDEITPLEVISLETLNGYTFAGTNYQGIFRYDSTKKWARINSGLDNYNTETVEDIIIIESEIFIGTGGGIYSSSDYGATWNLVFYPGINKSINALDYNNGFFAAAVNGTGVYLSTDHGATWSLSQNTGLDIDTSYWSIKIHENSIVTSTHDGDIFISENLGVSWSQISIPDNSYTPGFDLIFEEQKIYAGTNRGVYATADKGLNWNRISRNTRPTWSVAKIADKIYSATSNGIFETDESTDSYRDISDEIGHQATEKIFTNGEQFLVGTFSSGVWERDASDINENLEVNEELGRGHSYELYPNPVKNTLTLTISGGLQNSATVQLYNSLGKLIILDYEVNSEQAVLNLQNLDSGLYFVKVSSAEKTFVKRIVKQ